jgi:hypothetical protein
MKMRKLHPPKENNNNNNTCVGVIFFKINISFAIYETLTFILFIYLETNGRNPLQGEEPNREARDQRKSNPSQPKPSRLPAKATTIRWFITPSDLSTITPANTSR